MVMTSDGELQLVESRGPDLVQPGDPDWKDALAASFCMTSNLDNLNALLPGRVEMLAAPALSGLAPDMVAEIYRSLHRLCVSKDIFLLLDPPTATPAQGIDAGWFGRFRLGDSINAIALASFLRVRGGNDTPMPPSGAVAGLLDRVARSGGIWATPTGGQASLWDLDPVETDSPKGGKPHQSPLRSL